MPGHIEHKSFEQISNSSIPSLDTPSFKISEDKNIDGNVFATNQGVCFSCGKAGHWANNCPKPKTDTNRPPNISNYKSDTNKAPSKYDTLRKKLTRFRDSKRHQSNKFNYKQNKCYLTEADDKDACPIDPQSSLDNSYLEQDLNELIQELELEDASD